MKTVRADLHVHTLLSPCADTEMIPPLIVSEALSRQIGLIAITDHNASANAGAAIKAASETGLTVLPGMELQTREEVHVLCLFDTLEQLNTWQEVVNSTLPDLENNIEFFGEQFVVDETGDFIRREHRLLLTSSSLTFNEAWQGVTDLGGLFIPAHINRKQNGLLANLGFVPPETPVEGLEISRHISPQDALMKFPFIKRYPLIQSGDVHLLDSFLGSTTFTLEAPTIAEIRLALKGQDQRAVSILPC